MSPAIFDFVLFLCIIGIAVCSIAVVVALQEGYKMDWCALGGVLCCTLLLGWWGFRHGRGPDIGWND